MNKATITIEHSTASMETKTNMSMKRYVHFIMFFKRENNRKAETPVQFIIPICMTTPTKQTKKLNKMQQFLKKISISFT